MVCLITIFILSGCSAYMAAQKQGVPLEDVKVCKTRDELLYHKDIEVIETKQHELGEKEDTCKILKEKGSYGRATFNLIESLFTLGLWEAVSYHREQTLREEKYYYYIKVY